MDAISNDDNFDADGVASSVWGGDFFKPKRQPKVTGYDDLIEDSAARHGVDPDLIRAQMGTESNFKQGAVSNKGASGLMQLIPSTASRLGVKNIFDPKENIEGGVKYMRQLLDMFGGNVDLALAGYNAGEGAVKKYGNKIPPYRETRNYVRSIRSKYKGDGIYPSFNPDAVANNLWGATESAVNEEKDFDADGVANNIWANEQAPPDAENDTSNIEKQVDELAAIGEAARQGQRFTAPTDYVAAKDKPLMVPPETATSPLQQADPTKLFNGQVRVAPNVATSDVPQIDDQSLAQQVDQLAAVGDAAQRGERYVKPFTPDVEADYQKWLPTQERQDNNQSRATFAEALQQAADFRPQEQRTDVARTPRVSATKQPNVSPVPPPSTQIEKPEGNAYADEKYEIQLRPDATRDFVNAELASRISSKHQIPYDIAKAVIDAQDYKYADTDKPVEDINALIRENAKTKGYHSTIIGGDLIRQMVNATKANEAKAKMDDREYIQAVSQASENGLDDYAAKVRAESQIGKRKSEDADKEISAYYQWLSESGAGTPEYRAEHAEELNKEREDILSQYGSFAKLQSKREAVEKEYANKPFLKIASAVPMFFGNETLNKDRATVRNFDVKNRLSDTEYKNASNFGEGLKKFLGDQNTVVSEYAGLQTGIASGLLQDAANLGAGVLRIASPMLDWATDGNASAWLDRAAKQTAIVGQKAGEENLGFEIGQGVGQLPGIIGATTLSGGNPIVGFAVHSALTNTGKPIEEQTSAVIKSAVVGAVFEAAPIIDSITGPALKSLTETIGLPTDAGAGKIVNILAQRGIRMASVGGIGAGQTLAEGGSSDDAKKAFWSMALTDLGLSAFGHKPTDAELQKLDRKIITMPDETGKPVDVLITKNEKGGVDLTNVSKDIPEGVQQAVVAPKAVIESNAKARELGIPVPEKSVRAVSENPFEPPVETNRAISGKEAEDAIRKSSKEVEEIDSATKVKDDTGKESLYIDKDGILRDVEPSEPTPVRTRSSDEIAAENAKLYARQKLAKNTSGEATIQEQNITDIDAKTEPELATKGIAKPESASPKEVDGAAIGKDAFSDVPKLSGKASKVGLDIETQAIADKLTDTFGGTAEYTPKTVKEQAKRIGDILQTDMPRIQRFLRGEEQIPKEIDKGALISAVDTYARKNKLVELQKDLAKSNVVGESSVAAQTMRFLQERDPYSVNRAVTDVLQARQESKSSPKTLGLRQRKLEAALSELTQVNETLGKNLSARESELAKLHSEMSLRDLENHATAPSVLKVAEQIVSKLETRADAARKRLEKRGNVFTVGLDPIALKDLAEIGAAHLGRAGVDFAKWSERMIGEFGDKIKPHLEKIYEASNKTIESFGGKRVLDKEGAALRAIKTRLQSQIDELDNAINKRERIVRDKKKLEYDAEANSLKARTDELKSQYDEIFGKELSDEKRLQIWKDRTSKRVEELKGKIAKGKYEPTPKKSSVRLDDEAKTLSAKRDALNTRIRQLRQLTGDIADDEIAKLNDLSTQVESAKQKLDETTKDSPEYDKTRREYGRSAFDFKEAVDDMKRSTDKISFGEAVRSPLHTAGRGVKAIPGTAKSIQASMDDSAVFRQGWKTMFTNPGIWSKNALQSFRNLFGKYNGRDVERELSADIQSRDNALNGYYKKAKLDVGMPEEAYPTSLPEKVPLLGRAYKRTEAAYTAFVQKTRADIFDKMIGIAKAQKVELTDNELGRIGEMVNALTGRGDLGSLEKAGKAVNTIFFSPKFLQSHIDTLVAPFTGGSLASGFNGKEVGSSFVRRQAAQNLVKIVVGQAVVLAIAKSVAPNSVTLNPTSADFGKIKVGNTRFDITGGYGSLAVLAARMLQGESTNAQTGKVKDLNNPKFGEGDRFELLLDFAQNKLSPVGNIIRDVLRQKTRDGKTPTVMGEALSLITPLPVSNAIEVFKDPTASNVQRVSAILADALGIATNTYGYADPNAISSDAKKVQQKGDKVGALMDSYDAMTARGEDTVELQGRLKEKLENKMERGSLTDAEAERANKIFKTDEYIGQQENDEPPTIGRYNRNADNVIERIAGWAEAIGTDPLDAFDKLLRKGETFARMENGAIIVQRMSMKDSEAVKRKLGGGGKAVKLDHQIPLQLGGTNDESNLRLVTTEEWQSYTPVENALGQALHDGTISKADARDLVVKFKSGEITRKQIAEKLGIKEDDLQSNVVSPKAKTAEPKIRKKSSLNLPSLKMPPL